MSESVQKIIKYFCDRFLKIDYYPPKLSNILDLSLESMKNFNNEIVHVLLDMGVSSIRDLSKLTNDDVNELIIKKKIDPKILKNAIIGANLISNAWNKRTAYNKKVKNKIVIAGLDFAGKTSLINRLINDYSYQDIVNLEPTIGFNVEEYQTQRLNLIIWDLGGQKDHIREYLEEPEKYFVQVDVLIFLIDSQDDIRYDIALKYLSDIIDTLEYLEEHPFLMILLNKADSDMIDDPDFQIKLEYLNERILEIIENKKSKWYFELIKSSLFNIYSRTPDIVKNIKDIFSYKKDSMEEKGKVDASNIDIDKKLQQIMDINLKLMDKVASELASVKSILSRIPYSSSFRKSIEIPFENIALEYDLKKKRGKKKKRKEIQGPPQRLKNLPPPTLKSEQDSNKRIDSEEILKVKESLKQASIKHVPLDTEIYSQDFPKPPPIQKGGLYLQSQVIAELKDVFAKRGVSN